MSEGSPRSALDVPEQVDLREAARRLNVHYMTAYRYVRTGRLRATQRDSRWWVATADLQRLQASREGGPPRRGSADPTAAVGQLGSRLVAGDEPGAWRVLESAIVAGRAPASTVLDMLAPALCQIGDGWQRGDLTVGDEHLASAVATRLVGRLGPTFSRPGRTRGTVLLACVPGELHALPVAILAMVLRGEGYHVVELGADTPAEAIAEAARVAGNRLLAVGLSLSTPARREAVPACLRAIRAVTGDPALLLGGLAVTSRGQARALGADEYAADAVGAAAVIQQHTSQPRRH